MHSKNFNTITDFKQRITKAYLKEWFPTFLKKKKKYWKDIFVYDFFTGEEYDVSGDYWGSPLIILNELIPYQDNILNENLRLNVVLNDSDHDKIKKLTSNVILENYSFNIEFINEDFTELFHRSYPEMKKYGRINLPRLMFFNQQGVKYLTRDIFAKISDLKRTDFLLYTSSDSLDSYTNCKEFQKYLYTSGKDFDEHKPYQCHRIIFDYFKSMIPKNTEFYLSPFSLESKGNPKQVYGLIYGTRHLSSVEKFINSAWSLDGVCGEANFSIDGAIIEGSTYDLFNPSPRAKKLQYFKKDLVEAISDSNIRSLKDVYRYTFDYGCKPIHANKILSELQGQGKINNNVQLKSSNIYKLDDQISLEKS